MVQWKSSIGKLKIERNWVKWYNFIINLQLTVDKVKPVIKGEVTHQNPPDKKDIKI